MTGTHPPLASAVQSSRAQVGASMSDAAFTAISGLAKSEAGLILPVGIVTALAGIPLFVTLIVLQRRFG